MAAWEFCLKYCGVSEGFTHKMAECEFCLQDGGNSEFYPQYGGVEFFAYKMAAFPTVLPTRWQWGRFAYKMAAFLRVLPTRWRHVSFAYKMAAIPRVLPTIWRSYRDHRLCDVTSPYVLVQPTGAVPANQPISDGEATDRCKSSRRKMADCPSK